MRNQYADAREAASSSSCVSMSCFAMGAATMYLLDPERGARRRSMLRDKLFSSMKQGSAAATKAAQYTRDRTRGIIATTTARLKPDDASSEIVVERVRSAIGRVVSHPRAIHVECRDGMVTLRGAVLAHEVDELVATVQGVRGVYGVENRLDVHQQAGSIPDLQGGASRPGQRSALMQENWSPATRLWTGMSGAGWAVWGLGRRGLFGTLAVLVGGGMMLRSFTNLQTKRLTGIGAGRRAVDVQKTVNIHAPLDQVFGFFSSYLNFPRFMSNVREVRDHGSGRSHWVVAGPLGTNVEWDADLTDWIPNERIAWRSVEGSTVENAGVIRFDENPNGSTRVDIKISYNPPGGALGHALARLFGADPKSEMDGDLARVKTLLETGHPARDAAQAVR